MIEFHVNDSKTAELWCGLGIHRQRWGNKQEECERKEMEIATIVWECKMTSGMKKNVGIYTFIHMNMWNNIKDATSYMYFHNIWIKLFMKAFGAMPSFTSSAIVLPVVRMSTAQWGFPAYQAISVFFKAKTSELWAPAIWTFKRIQKSNDCRRFKR